eukprot:4936139-Pyramimonas_sp.AAC.1
MTRATAAEALSQGGRRLAQLAQGVPWMAVKGEWADSPWTRERWDHFTLGHKEKCKGRARPEMV